MNIAAAAEFATIKCKDHLRDLFTALCKLCHCSDPVGSGNFIVNIAINSIIDNTEDNDWFGVDLVLAHHHRMAKGDRRKWKKARILIWKRAQSLASEITSEPAYRKVLDLCRLARSEDSNQLHLSLVDGELFEVHSDTLPETCRLSLSGTAFSLADLLGAQCLKNDEQRRVLLSYVIAKAAWQFYDSDLMSQPWTKHTVQFMPQRARAQETGRYVLDHRPYISTSLMAGPSHADGAIVLESRQPRKHEQEFSPQLSHIYPTVLALGLLLLEIELGHDILGRAPIDAAAPDYRLHPNTQHQIAAKIIVSPEWKTRENVKTAVRQAIEICIKPDTGVLGHDPNLINQRLFSKVVQPLRSLFTNMYKCEDGCPENFDPGPIKLDFPSNKLGNARSAAELSTQLDSEESNEATENYTKEIWSVDSKTDNVHIQDWALFGDEVEDLHHLGNAVATDAWVARFKDQLIAKGIGRDKFEPIKVAIIDTGIDMSHEDIKEQEETGRIKQCKSFVPGEDATVDRSGHGTHIAGIVLDLTRNVELYIAKIFNTRIHDQKESIDIRERMVQALSHCRETWKVNMISLSFGYSRPSSAVRNEIDTCLAQKIVIFASASNDAGNRPRTYPGGYEDVLCIHSATGEGNASNFNPSPEEEDDNFAFVGEELDSCWTAGVPINGRPALHDLKRRRSGTSFATPVALATAAFMVGYIRREIKGHDWSYEPLSPRGVRRIFRKMSQKRDNYKWVDPEWYFNQYRKAKIIADLIHVLDARPQES